ncbi:hypothetical protein [Rhodanobacter sp. L36]|uniref:hypothetical protein n=1 Tax=Rhodanobacter sp. L36 TaxID=1747221 RepID=UPI00131E3092|nr:hypothetical protein [Rhodanobacter sp. L36]
MASEKSSTFNYIIVGLLVVNLCITSYLALRPASFSATTGSAKTKVDVSELEAGSFANEVVKLYNKKDNVALYAKFDNLAKAQFSQEQLNAQLNKLYPLIGTISDATFSDAVVAESSGGRDYYNLNYKVRLTGGPFNTGDMKLTVIRRESGLSLIGFFVNGSSR